MNISDYFDMYQEHRKKDADAEHERSLMKKKADLERTLAVEKERAVLAVKEEFGLRIKELEDENEQLKVQLEDIKGGEWRRDYPLLSLTVGLIMAGKTREEIQQHLLAQGFPRNQIAMLTRSKLDVPTDDALKKAAQRIGK